MIDAKRVARSTPGLWLLLTAWVVALGCCKLAGAQDAKELVRQMVAREDAAGKHKQYFLYVAVERSERTGGHEWKERVAETGVGKVRLLLAVDGQPLPAERAAAERSRLARIVTDPSGFLASEREKKGDDDRAKAMLELLPKAFLLKNARPEGEFVRVDFEPNPEYQTQTTEEKVLHGMFGSLTMDARGLRLHAIAAKLPKDVSVGFGLVNIHAGSGFQMERVMLAPDEWKTRTIDTSINGRAILFKSLGKNDHVVRSEFKLLPFDVTLAQAVAMVTGSK